MSESNMKILVVAQHNGSKLSSGTLATLTAAQQLAELNQRCSIDLLIIGDDCQNVATQAKEYGMVERILVAEHSAYVNTLSEVIAPVIVKLASGYSHVLAVASTFGKDLMPRVAALLDVGQLSDVIEFVSADTVIRPIYAGNALAKVQSHDAIKVITVRESAFDKVQASGNQEVQIVEVPAEVHASNTEFVERKVTVSERPELAAARVVVSGGRGLGSKEQFQLVEQLADKLGGAIGASRAAVDAGYVSNDLQVGQTGKVVAPDLYIAVGISGAIQHIAGMKESKVIVAINSDPDAPIFEVADYGLVGDLFEILPELIDAV